MCKFVFNYKLGNKNKNFIKDISFNYLFLSKIINFKKFHKIYNNQLFDVYHLNFNLLIYYNKSTSYFIIKQFIASLINYMFLLYKNIFVKRYSYNYIVCSILNVNKFHEFILCELKNYKNYIYPYVLLNSNLIILDDYISLFKIHLKNIKIINNNFYIIIIKRIIYLFYLIRYFFISSFKK